MFELFKDVPIVTVDENTPKSEEKQCEVCYTEFSENDPNSVRFEKCLHCGICRSCFKRYVAIRIRDGESIPWIPCPMEDCDVYLTPKELFSSGVSTKELYQMGRLYLQKHLARQRSWVECIGDKCLFGFFMGSKAETKTSRCELCGLEQEISKKQVVLDEDFMQMVKEVRFSEVFSLCNDVTYELKVLSHSQLLYFFW